VLRCTDQPFEESLGLLKMLRAEEESLGPRNAIAFRHSETFARLARKPPEETSESANEAGMPDLCDEGTSLLSPLLSRYPCTEGTCTWKDAFEILLRFTPISNMFGADRLATDRTSGQLNQERAVPRLRHPAQGNLAKIIGWTAFASVREPMRRRLRPRSINVTASRLHPAGLSNDS